MYGLTQEVLDAAAGRWPARSADPRPRPASLRVFRSAFLEAVSHAHPSLPAILWIPPAIGLVVTAVGAVGPLRSAALFLLGWLAWTLIEYVLHRALFHWEGTTQLGRLVHFMAHGYHHEFPDDRLRLVAPPMMSIPISALVGGLWYLVLGETAWTAALAGTIFGYLCYDYVHYYTHHFRPRGGPGKWLRAYHMRHHFEGEDSRYGVSNPLWDLVFGTYAPARGRPAEPVSARTGSPGRAP